MARCGEINVWHWAHLSRSDCDTWSEGEGEWHLAWKRQFPLPWREFVVGDHRADIKSPQGIIELQSSGISVTEVGERETHYGEMVWLVDAREFNLRIRNHVSYVTFRWKYPHKTWWYAQRPLFFDIGGRLIEVRRIYRDVPCGGSGRFLSYAEFVQRFSRPKHGDSLCEECHLPFRQRDMVKAGMSEYYTMDIDPGTFMCGLCYENQLGRRVPEDPSLFDVYTPVAVL